MKDPIRILVFSALFIILTLYMISNPFYSVFNFVQGKKHSRIADKNDIVSSSNSEKVDTEAPLEREIMEKDIAGRSTNWNP